MTNCPLTSELRASRKFIADRLEEPFESVIEVGCQLGENLLAIQNKFKDKRLVGVDINKEVINEAKKHLKGIDLFVADIFDMPFKRDEFDIVFTNALLCMLRPVDIEIAVRQLIKLAKKKIYMIELMGRGIGYAKGGRTMADYPALFHNYCLEATAEKLSNDVFNAEPWNSYGYFIEITL